MKYFILLIFTFTLVFAEQYDRPLRFNEIAKTIKSDIRYYSWMKTEKGCKLLYLPRDDSNKFITAKELKNYFKLKMRNFVRDFSIDKKINNHYPHLICSFQTEIYQYNDKLEIYTGLLEFEIISHSGKNFRITYPIAGADIQIREQIKDVIDSIVENFATDYYYMQDLK